jgi:hypothetical protein
LLDIGCWVPFLPRRVTNLNGQYGLRETLYTYYHIIILSVNAQIWLLYQISHIFVK